MKYTRLLFLFGLNAKNEVIKPTTGIINNNKKDQNEIINLLFMQ